MMYASRCRRSSAIRRLLPQNHAVRDATRCAGLNARGDRPCSGGAPARGGGLGHLGADREVLDEVVISGRVHLRPEEAGELASDRAGND